MKSTGFYTPWLMLFLSEFNNFNEVRNQTYVLQPQFSHTMALFGRQIKQVNHEFFLAFSAIIVVQEGTFGGRGPGHRPRRPPKSPLLHYNNRYGT